MTFKKKIIILILLSLLISNENKKIALVLSGGGAKGIAQIPILEMIDSLNIPIDYIVGTSMGSINGAMYAMGYSPEEIKYHAFETNWDLVFSNKKQRNNLYYFQKNDLDEYQIEFTLNGIKPVAPIALANGHSSYMNINNKTKNHEHLNNFDELLIPFRCNAVNLLNGQEIIFSNGSLSNALRASSSIPSIFSPIINDSLLLVDGGVINNLPIDIAKKIGADIIIGINVSPINKRASDIQDVFDVLSQSILVNGYQKRINNRKLADLIIEPNVESYGTIDYSNEALKALYANGKIAANDNLDNLLGIKNLLLIPESKTMKLSAIPNNELYVKKIIINSSDNILYNELFPNMTLPTLILKEEFIRKISHIRNSNKYSHLNYYFKTNKDSLTLIINIKKIENIKIENIIIKNNNVLKEKFIKNLLNLKTNTILNINELRSNIHKAYNLDLFNSIRYKLEKTGSDSYIIIIIVEESSFHTMKLSTLWNNYYKLVGKIKFSLFNKPFKKFKFTNEIKFGENIKENEINMYYIGNYNYQSQIIPTIKYKNSENDISYMNSLNSFDEINISNKNYSVHAIIPFNNLGYIDLGFNKQKIKYKKLNNYTNEKLTYYNIILNIDQINNILYPSKGYKYNFYFEHSITNYNYYLYKFNFDHFINLNKNNNLKIYGDFILSNLKDSEQTELIEKSINYFNYDRTLSYSEYDLYVNEIISYGIEYNYSYKNSTTFRIICNNINSIHSKLDNENDNNIFSYGLGFRIKSILGPINFLWSNANKSLYNLNNNDTYFFSLGVNL